MDWALFCQIEVIILTVGLVVAYLISMNQTTKDNSFCKRLGLFCKGIGAAIEDFNKTIQNVQKMEKKNDE